MRFVIHFTWIYLLIVGINYSFGVRAPVSYPRDIRIYNVLMSTTPHSNLIRSTNAYYSKNCNIACRTNGKSTVVVQTAFDIWTGVNVPVSNNVMAIVYYNCTNNINTSAPGQDEYHKFQKVCGDIIEECRLFINKYDSKWVSIYNIAKPQLDINFVLADERKTIKIQTEKCISEEKIIFNFKTDGDLINYRKERDYYNYTDKYFIASQLEKSPIVLTITKFPSKDVADVKFDIMKKRVALCSYNTINYCPHLCRNKTINVSAKCYLNLGKKSVEIKNINNCSDKDLPAKIDQRTFRSDGMCQYYMSRNIRLCEYLCVDRPQCSYMCLEKNKTGYIETGYKKSILEMNYTSFVGSGRWSIDNIPHYMVFVNECLNNSQLCTKTNSCEDRPNGYICKYNDYTGVCDSISSRFWRCPDGDLRVHISDAFDILIDIENIMLQKSKPMTKLDEVTNYIVVNYEKLRSKAMIFYRIIKSIDKLLDMMALENLRNSSEPDFQVNNNHYQASKITLNETKTEYSIPLSTSKSGDGKQFVKLIFKDEAPPGTASNDLTFFRTKYRMESNGSSNFKSRNDTGRLMEQNRKNISGDMLMASDMIIVRLNQTRNVSIQFRLNKISYEGLDSWLFQYTETCGYMDDSDVQKGTWSEKGCQMRTSVGIDYCECDHLSVFALMFKFKMVNEYHLKVLTYLSLLGGIINAVSLILFLIFVLFINSRDKLRLDQLNIAICLLVGTIVFLLGAHTSHNYILCRITAIFAQFLFLSAFVWKLILGINVVRLIASLRYQNEDWMVKYRFGVLAVGYGAPLLIVLVFGSLYWGDYGQISGTTEVCWIDSQSNAFLSFIIPVGIILAINMIVLFFIANTLVRNYINTRKTKFNESNELMVFFQLMIAMGLTWVPSYFATVYLVAMYMLVIFFPLQGLMMFMFVVVINQENRQKVSTFVAQRYSTLLSKSTLSTDTKNHTKSKSTSSKSTDQNMSLLSESDKDKEKEVRARNLPMVVLTDQDEAKAPLQNPVC